MRCVLNVWSQRDLLSCSRLQPQTDELERWPCYLSTQMKWPKYYKFWDWLDIGGCIWHMLSVASSKQDWGKEAYISCFLPRNCIMLQRAQTWIGAERYRDEIRNRAGNLRAKEVVLHMPPTCCESWYSKYKNMPPICCESRYRKYKNVCKANFN